jgi:hypothetical protein
MVRAGVPPEQEECLREMCRASQFELLGRLRGEVSPLEIQSQFVRASATLALSLYLGLEAGGELTGLSAGSLHIERQKSADLRTSVESLRRQAELMLAGYLSDGGFSFRAVRA